MNQVTELLEQIEANQPELRTNLCEKIKNHWPQEVEAIIKQEEDKYLIITKPGVNFSRFEKVFTAYITTLIQLEWKVQFHIFDADFGNDFIAVN